MKGLIKNYIDKLSIDTLKEFALKNDVNLSDTEFEYLLNLTKENFEDMLENEEKYLNEIKNNINSQEFEKVKELYLRYKNKYKGYLF